MKQYILKLIVNSLILFLPLVTVAQSGWREFTDQDGNFGIMVPDNPKRIEKDSKVQEEEIISSPKKRRRIRNTRKLAIPVIL